MDTLKILKYKDLETINQYDGKDFIIKRGSVCEKEI